MTRAQEFVDAATRKFARGATVLTTRVPALWPLVRGPVRGSFDRLAPRWNTILRADHAAIVDAVLSTIEASPARALDLGTGTGVAAVAIARRFPAARVVGVDLAQAMVDEARRGLPDDVADRVRFEQADAAQLPFPAAHFELVVLLNMIVFFEELARVTAAGGAVAVCFSRGADTPIYVPERRLRDGLAAQGFDSFHALVAGEATALVARKR